MSRNKRKCRDRADTESRYLDFLTGDTGISRNVFSMKNLNGCLRTGNSQDREHKKYVSFEVALTLDTSIPPQSTSNNVNVTFIKNGKHIPPALLCSVFVRAQ